MTVKQLQKKLAKIPATNAINKARRREIIAMINKMVGGNA